MDVKEPTAEGQDADEPQRPHGHHRSARERQRRGPMWGCLGALLKFFVITAVVIALILGFGWWYVGSTSFAGLVRARIEKTLEARLGRDVTIGSVEISRGRPQKVIVNDVRIANSPGAVHPYFATVKQLVITGGIESFWTRKINVGRIDIVDPRIFFEIYPTGAKLVHNFPKWQSGPRSRYEIYHLTLNKMYVTGGAVDFLDRRHNVAAVASGLATDMTVTTAEDRYAGVVTGQVVRVRIQDYVPFDVDLRGAFVYEPNMLALQSIAMRGRGMELFLNGKLQPLSDGVYDLKVGSRMTLARVREIFRINKTLEGTIALAGDLKGKQGDFTLTGGWSSPKVSADVYDLVNAKGRMNVTGDHAIIDVDRAGYGGGSVSAHYMLPTFAEPYPQDVELRYDRISLEKLFSDWNIKDTGLRGGATGRLVYHWNKDKVLEGSGEGNAALSRNTTAFSNAKYPIAFNGGNADFALDNGTVIFRNAQLKTDLSTIGFRGKLRIEDVNTDLLLNIESSDFSELDRAAYNFAHSAGKKTYTLLGLGGSGTITGSVQGKLKTPQVVAHIAASNTKYNNVVLGDSNIDLKYDGARGVLTFERSTFRDANGTLALTGTIAFPDRGPSPIFDLAVDAANYPIDKAMATVNLKLAAKGLGTGKLLVTGSPDSGRVHFAGLNIVQGNSQLRLDGDVAWKPGKGNVDLNLDVAAKQYPVADLITFFDLGTMPVTGELTGTLHLSGPKAKLEGAGSISIANGSLYGETINRATADIAFTQGRLRARNVTVAAPAGTITGEAELDLGTNQFSYTIKSSSIDLSKLKALSSLAGLLGGNITLTSTGAGTLDQPEVVLEATLNQATLRGLTLPPDFPPPTLYLAIRNGRLIVKGAVANLVTIDGDGTLAPDGTLDGLVRIVVSDIAKVLAISPNTATLPARGNITIEAKLGGKLSSLEALRIDATVPVFNVAVSEHQFIAARPLRIGLRDGRVVFDDFALQLKETQSTLAVTGFAEITGAKRLNVDVRGTLEAALAQLFIHDLKAEGHIVVAGGVHGTLSAPTLAGTAEFQDAQLRFAGFPQIIDHLTGTLVFRGDRIDIDALRAQVGGGTVVAGGAVTLNGMTPQRARITLQGTNVAIRYFEGLTMAGNFSLLLAGDADRFVLSGDVTVDRALYYKDFDFRTSLLNVVLSRRGVTPIVSASWQDRVALRVHLSAPGTLAVRNNIADVTGSGDLDVNGTLANPVVLGLVSLDEGGRVRFNNVDYHVVRGSINFQNPFRIDPYFDVTVEGRVNGGFSEVESGPVDVSINVTGTLDRISPTITSDPPASDITLFSLLGFGALTTPRAGASGSGAEATTAGRSLLYQSIINAVGSRLFSFADAFSYDPGNLDTTGDPGAKVTIEKRLSNALRIVVVYNMSNSRNKELLEWQANPEWTVQFTRDEPHNEYRLEGRFRRRYEGHWTLGRRTAISATASMTPLATPEGTALPPPVQQPPSPLPPGPHLPSREVPFDGRTITAISFRSDGRFDTTTLTQYISLKVGDQLTIRNVQSSIKSVFATGDFRDVRVEAVADGDGAAVTFVLYLNYRVAAVTFDGIGGADRTRAERELTIRTGDVVSLSAVDHSATAVLEFLNRSGYLEAAVDPETTFHRERNRADVIFHVTTGARAKVAGVVFEGGDLAPFTPAQLIEQMRNRPGSSFSVAEARLDGDRMRQFLLHREYRKADIRYLTYVYDAATKTVTLRYRASVGPLVKVEVEGVSRRSVRGLIPFRNNQPYSEDIIDRAANAIVTSYQQRGYFNASVDTEGALANGVWTTTFHVNPGQQFRVTAVTFTGNAKIDDKTLASVVTTAPGGGFRNFLGGLFRHPNGVTRAQLSGDRDAIESYYRLQGFSDATVDTPVALTHPDGTLTIDFPITEGAQTLLADVHVEGNEQVKTAELPKLQLKPGDPLNPQLLRDDLVALQTFYADRGNAEVQITPRADASTDKTSARLAYVIAEGPKIKVDEVIVRGNSYTNSSVILRKAQLEKGDPFSYSRILEAQRNLYRLGIFGRVDIQPEQAGTSVADRNVVIQVEEGKDLTVSGSVGVSSGISGSAGVQPLGSVSVAHRNLFGTGRYAGLELIGSQDRQEAFLTYREPFIGKYDVPVQLTVFQSDDLRRGVHLRQRGSFIELSRVARAQTRWSLRYEYRLSDCVNDPKNPNDLCALANAALIPDLDRSFVDVQISSITPTFFWDKRDDPFDPHHGFFTSASVEYAFPIFAAKAGFLKEFVQGAWYLPLSARNVLAFSGRVGLIQPLARYPNGSLRPVPLSERFTGGGETSHRAFRLDQLGTVCLPGETDCEATLIRLPDGRIAALGGNALFIANAEYRFPIAGSVGGALFVDMGNVYKDTIHFNDIRYGVGTGVRYLSPVGPLRFDVGYKLNRRPVGVDTTTGKQIFERPLEYFITLGYAF
jgi:outer membrane protein assembly complex protein YaeT